MNRIMARGLWEEAKQGKQVLIMAPNPRHRDKAFETLYDVVNQDRIHVSSVLKSPATKRITAVTRGSIEFLSETQRDAFRGLEVDVAVLDGWSALEASDILHIIAKEVFWA